MAMLASGKAGDNIFIAENLPGWQFIRYSGLDRDNPSTYVFEHPKNPNTFISNFTSDGYSICTPTRNIEVIRNRQQVISAFVKDILSDNKYYPVLNMLHLISRLSRMIDPGRHPHFDLSACTKMLERYLQETQTICSMFRDDCSLFRNKGSFLEQLAEDLDNNTPKNSINQILKACQKEAFDYVLIRIKDGNYEVHGMMGALDSQAVQKSFRGRSSPEEELGFSMRDFVIHAFGQAIEGLNSIYSPLGALYFEAAYYANRIKQGKRIVMPEINTEGVFSITGGEPVLLTTNPVGASLAYDAKTAKIILNGLHSGGKTYLLNNIPLWHLKALSGFWLNADQANVPVIKRVLHSFSTKKVSYGGGSLFSEMQERARSMVQLKTGDMYLMDEFLQHASPDAAEDLEPVILEEFWRTGATIVVVTHRGESLSEDNWNFYSPTFEKKGERIIPTYEFVKGRPSQKILKMHAKQMLVDIVSSGHDEKQSQSEKRIQREGSYQDYSTWLFQVEKRIFSGSY